MLGNERGIALIITLLVVALLAITVIEFTYSVQIDAHMTRNALDSLQASVLARSGVSLGEALLLRDADPLVDAYTEEWCPEQVSGVEGDRPACNIDTENSLLVIPEHMRLRVQILDESSKLNINLTRPQTINQWRAAKTNPTVPQIFQAWQTALANLMSGRGVSPQVADEIQLYWDQAFETIAGPVGAAVGPGAGPQGSPTPAVRQTPGIPLVPDFPSLDDASVIPGFSAGVVRQLRPVVTAIQARRQTQVNVNTAPREVLNAIVGDAGIVDQIISQREGTPLQQRDLAPLLSSIDRQDPEKRYIPNMLGVRSSYFLIRASAVVNPNPVTGRGGIGRSAAMLVRRDPKPGVPANAPAGTSRWTLTRLDWQKEGGAALFQQRTEQGPGSEESSAWGVY